MTRLFTLICMMALAMTGVTNATAQVQTPVSQMEKITRGVVAIHTTSGNYISWRMLGTDDKDVTFDLLRDGTAIVENQSLTSYKDASGTTSSVYQVVTHNASGDATSEKVTPWDDIYKNIKLNRPAADDSYLKMAADSDRIYAYYPHDSSLADLDGDGEYEIVVMWRPTNYKDNAVHGFTGNCILDAYEIMENGNLLSTAKQLWRVDLGKNIRSGSHYTQFLVYDFDGDGKAEMICKTAPGSIDGKGNYVNQASDDATVTAGDNTIDYRTAKGRPMSGPEYLTVFNGETGAAINTVWYNPNRAGGVGKAVDYPESSFWGDAYGNRGERYLACVAYLQGADKNPSAVMCRGYYTRAYLWAVNFDGKKLSTFWRHASISKTMVQLTDSTGTTRSKVYNTNTSGTTRSYTAYGNGNHNLSVGDVDGDGCDEIIYGACAIDNDGSLLYSTGLGHGDAMHLGDLVPDHPGLEVFTVHEDSPYGFDLHDAATGEILKHVTGTGDNGRGMAADVDLTKRGYEFWSAASYDVYDNDFNVISTDANSRPPYSHRVYWKGEPRDCMLDGVNIYYNGQYSKSVRLGDYGGTACAGGSKAFPNVSADFLGDWREEVILFCKNDSASLNIFSTTETTKVRVPCLMHDHTYRMGIAWQNVAYNQPPHLGYFLPDSVSTKVTMAQGTMEYECSLGSTVDIEGTALRCTNFKPVKTLVDGAIKSFTGLPSASSAYGGLTYSFDAATGSFILTGAPKSTGVYEIVMKSTGNPLGTELQDTITINVKEYVKGDVNGDGQVNISDVNAVISVMCGTASNPRADVNGDALVNIADVNAIIAIMCGTDEE